MSRTVRVLIIVLTTTLVSFGQKSGYSGGSNTSGSQSSGGSTDQSAGGGGGGGGKGGGGGGQNAGGGGGGGGGFAIESEMLAYKALESDSEAVACDVAEYLLLNQPSETDIFYPAGPRKTETGAGTEWERLTRVCGSGAGRDWTQWKPHRPAIDQWGVIVLSSNDPTIGSFQAWRLNMALVGVLLRRAEPYTACCPSISTPYCAKPTGSTSENEDHVYKGKPSSISLSGSPIDIASSAVSLIQSAAQLFAVNESVAGVAGTIGDQALIDGISRHLRSLEIPVLAPGIYPSFGLEAQLNANNQYVIAASPFLAALQQLADDRVCLQGQIQDLTARINDANEKLKGATTDQQTAKTNAKTAEDNVAKAKTKTDAEKAKAKADADKAQSDLSQANTDIQTNTANLATYKVTLTDVQAIATSIDNYVTSLFGGTSQSKSSQSDSSSKGTDNSGSSPSAQDQGSTQNQSPKQDQGSTQPQSQNIGASNAPINAILAADGVVRRLNYSKDMVDIYRWEILAVKALESGGGVLTKSNLFGSKVYFSGGAVATYALFQMDGSLRCSGNVYDYDGYIREKDFNRAFRRPDISPDKQMIFYRGRCTNLGTEIPPPSKSTGQNTNPPSSKPNPAALPQPNPAAIPQPQNGTTAEPLQ